MAEAKFQETFEVSKDKLFDAITAYREYPKFVADCKSVKVLEEADGKAKVKYSISLMKDIEYVLEHKADRKKGTITWKLVESSFIKKNVGSWKLNEVDEGETEVTYEIDIEFSVPVPSLILGRLVKGSLPKMVQGFVDRANKKKK